MTDTKKSRSFVGVNLTGAKLDWANFNGEIVTGANFTDANLYQASFIGADLTGTNFTKANLTRANLTGANLTRTNFTGAILTGVEINRAAMATAMFSERQRSQFTVLDDQQINTNVRDAITLSYSQGITGEELTTLSSLIEALRTLEPGVVLALESIATDEGGATRVVISVKDLGGRTLAKLQQQANGLQVVQQKLSSSDRSVKELEERLKNVLFEKEMSKPNTHSVGSGRQYLHVLFADVSSFTAMSDDQRNSMLLVLRALARPLVETCRGRLINMEGDCVIAVFHDINDALLAAFNLQAHLAIEGPDSHAALASGEVNVASNSSLGDIDIAGETVNLTARLLGVAKAGEIVASSNSGNDPDLDVTRFIGREEFRPLKKAIGELKAGTPVPCCVMTMKDNHRSAFTRTQTAP